MNLEESGIDLNILLVSVPWQNLNRPSLGLGILAQMAKQAYPSVKCRTLYLNIKWFEYLSEHMDLTFTATDYSDISEELFDIGGGDFVFSSSLHKTDEWQSSRYAELMGDRGDLTEKLMTAHRLAPRFIDEAADAIIQMGFDVIGLSSVFSQNVACLALAQALKDKSPQIKIIMGGANCDGVQGTALHKSYDFLDYVASGEGESTFPAFLDYLAGNRPVTDIPGLCWRENGKSGYNPPAPLPPGSELVRPDYDEYFDQVEKSSRSDIIRPELVMESSRGCWWGQKHHCTFCGLNGAGMAFRNKDADTMLEELIDLVAKYQVLDVVMADNIISMEYFRSFLPRLAEHDWDIRLHYEVKANLKRDQLALLRDAGVNIIQPGIESVSTRLLGLMRKGVSGPRNVALLRDCEAFDLTVQWYLLTGFPGETSDDFLSFERYASAMSHLQPPRTALRISLERFSPYFDDLSLGFQNRRHASHYDLIYDLPDEALTDIAYLFDTDNQGISDKKLTELRDLIDSWHRHYQAGSRLTQTEIDGEIVICDERAGWEHRTYGLPDSIHAYAYRCLDQPLGTDALLDALSGHDPDMTKESVLQILSYFEENGLVFCDDGHYLALATLETRTQKRMAA